jgi:hypothetical protein
MQMTVVRTGEGNVVKELTLGMKKDARNGEKRKIVDHFIRLKHIKYNVFEVS